MSPDELKQAFGDEYPAAVTLHGIRMPLTRETRFSRNYHNEQHRCGSQVSRFHDGSAEIAFAQVLSEWPDWSEDERVDFCDACSWIPVEKGLPDIVRFLMQQTNPRYWERVVLVVAHDLPQDEAFTLLTNALREVRGGHTANFTQAIAATRHPDARRVLREHLEALWQDARLWHHASFTNWTAFDATCCIQRLLELGAPPHEFEDKVRSLSAHACQGNRECCSRRLHEHYEWLPPPPALPPPFAG